MPKPNTTTDPAQRTVDAAVRLGPALTPGRFYCRVCRDEKPNEEIARMRNLLNAWLFSGGMVSADLDKLRADTEEALQHG